MKTSQYILTLFFSLSLTLTFASIEGTIIESPRNDAGIILDYKNLSPVFPMQATFAEELFFAFPGQPDLYPVIPFEASFEEIPGLLDLTTLNDDLRPEIPMKADFSETLL